MQQLIFIKISWITFEGIHNEKEVFGLVSHFFDHPFLRHPSRQFGHVRTGDLVAQIFVFSRDRRFFEIG